MKPRSPLLTVAELKLRLSSYSDDMLVDFSGLDFARLKQRGDNLVQVEFNQQVYRNDEGRVEVQNLE
jgi:hypothetical protein